MRDVTTNVILVWIAICTPVFAQGGGMEVLPQAVEMSFPQGYRVCSEDGKVLKTAPGPASATIKAKAVGKSFASGEVYLSDWSFDRMQKGEKPNWIVPNAASAAPTTPQASSPNTPKELVLYPSAKEVNFPEGYSVFTDDGQLIKTVAGPTSVTVKAESSTKSFAKGKAYLSDWSYNQLQQGKRPNWVASCERIWWQGLPALERATSEVRKLAISDIRGVRSEHARQDGTPSTLSSRGMAVVPNASHTAPRTFEGVELYPDAIMGQFPNGYTVYDETGAPMRFIAGPVAVMLRGKVSFSETPDENPSGHRMTVYLSESSYQAVKTQKAIEWIGPGEYLPYTDVYAGPFRVSSDVWSTVDKELPALEGFDSDAWGQVDAYNGAGVISDIVLAHHPLTYNIFKELGEGYSLVDGRRKWRDPWVVHGCSESIEMPSGMGMSLSASLFDKFAALPAREREWYDQTLPGIYQAVADVFRRDMETHVTTVRAPTRELPEVPESAVYLEFHRSPFVLLQKNGGDDGTYTRRFTRATADMESGSVAPDVLNKPSYYGVRIYKGGMCVEDVPIFGAVDFEIFVELMLRNYTRRAAGLSMESSDEWLRGFCDTVYKEVFGKIADHLSDAKTIYWKADGYFHLVPLDLIAVSCGGEDGIAEIPMVEVAGSETASKTTSFSDSLRKHGALLVANPEYDAGSVASVAESLYDEGTRKLVTRAFAERSLSFTDLPGADEEVTHLSASLASWGARNVGVLRGNDASEQAVLQALETSGMAHIATHGFYLDMTSATDERAKPLLNELKNSNNPYFRSGLALAGANRTLGEWSKGNVTGSPVDGVLLAAEVRNLDLSNLSLLVLSACSTAEGRPVDGKSVASLRDAFLQAGVETLVSTLWDIPDDFAVKLMGDFYERLLAGDTPSIALWRAKKDNFLELRKTTGFAESMVKVAPFVAVTQAAKPD